MEANMGFTNQPGDRMNFIPDGIRYVYTIFARGDYQRSIIWRNNGANMQSLWKGKFQEAYMKLFAVFQGLLGTRAQRGG
jgi:hypothetical protein